MSVIVLNADYTFLHTINWKRAVNLVMKGKVEVMQYSQKMITSFNKKLLVPLIVRLIKFVRQFYKKKIPMNRKNVFIRDEFVCQYCGNSCKKSPTLDHIIPKSRGGSITWENTVTACSKCNQRKGNKTPSEANITLIKRPVRPTINEFAQKKLNVLGFERVFNELLTSKLY